MRGTSLLEGDNTVPGCQLTEEEKKLFLQTLERCRDYGCDFYPTIIQPLRYDEMSEVAAYGGFPQRYPHWYWGMQYEELQRGYEYNQHRIYEMVINCCDPSTKVLSKEGSKTAEEVKVNDEIMGAGGWRRVVATKRQSSSKVFRLNFKGLKQSIVCTPNHKWLCLRDGEETWVEARNMDIGEVVFGGAEYNKFLGHSATLNWSPEKVTEETGANVRNRLLPISVPSCMTLELAELMGILTGGGSTGCRLAANNFAVTIHKSLRQFQKFVADLIYKVFGREAAVHEKDTVNIIGLSSKYAVDFLDTVGIKKGCTYKNKRIPWSIWSSSNEFRAAYLRGLFDTDGYCGKYLSLSCYNDDLASDVQLILLEMGIRSIVKRVKNKHNDIAIVCINGKSNVRKFENLIGFSLKYKKDRLEKLASRDGRGGKTYKVPGIMGLIKERVKKIAAPPDWIYQYANRYVNREPNLNSIYGFLSRAIDEGYEEEFGDLYKIVARPHYVLESKEILSPQETIDIALDHDRHDFLANGLVTHNTNPSVIYILKSNTLVDNICVVAHATGHNDFFKNNIHFQRTDQNMLNKLANDATRIRKYMKRWGQEKVTEFIDHVLRIQTLIDPAKAWQERKIKEPVIRDHREYEFPRLLKADPERIHMHPWLNPKEYVDRENERIRKLETARELDLFTDSDKDVFGFIKNCAPLKPWQEDIISMLYEEAMYFAPQRITKCINEGWACGRSHMLVLTDQGYLTLGEIVDKKLKVRVHDGLQFQSVTNWFKFENKECLKIITKRGYCFEGSVTHKMFTDNFEWKQLRELNIGDKLTLSHNNKAWSGRYQRINFTIKNFTKSLSQISREHGVTRDYLYSRLYKNSIDKIDDESLRKDLQLYVEERKELEIDENYLKRNDICIPKKMDENLASFCGYLIGDGHIAADNDIGLTTSDESQADNYIDLVKKLFGLECSKRWDDSSLNGRWRISSYSKHLKDFLLKLGFGDGVCARNKKIPEIILRSPKKVISAFLRSYFDCDACADIDAGIILSTSSTALAEQIQMILLNYGILSSRYAKEKDNYHIQITCDSAKVFFKEINFNLERKSQKLEKYISKKNQNNCNQDWCDTIEEIHKTGIHTVYDITVEDTHRYTSQGFINHNSFIDYEILTRQGLVSLGQETHDAGIFQYAHHKMGVLGGKYSMNPYKLGFYLFLDVEERWNKGMFGTAYEECKDIQKKENWDLNLGLGKEKIFEVREFYDDFTFINEFFTQEFCDRFEFFEWKRYPNGEYKIESRDHKKIKKKLLQSKLNGGLPDIRIADPNHRNKNWLLLQHYWDGRLLHEPYAREVLTSLYYFWGKEVVLATRDLDGVEGVFVCVGTDPEKDIVLMPRTEYEEKW